MIVINKMERVHYHGKVRLLPGSNVVNDADFDVNHPLISAMIADGLFEVETEVTEKVAVAAIREANTQATVDEIVKASPKSSKSVKEKAGKRKEELDKFDAAVKAEIEAERMKKSSEG